MKVNYLQTSKSVTAHQWYNMLTMFLEIFCKIIKCTKDDTCYHWLFTLDKNESSLHIKSNNKTS